MGDLSEFFASSTVEHVKQRVGGSGFVENYFVIDKSFPHRFNIWGNYLLSFKDEGRTVSFELELREDIAKVDVGRLGVPDKYKDVIQRVGVRKNSDKLCVDVDIYPSYYSGGTLRHKKKVFRAGFSAGIKHLLNTAYELSR